MDSSELLTIILDLNATYVEQIEQIQQAANQNIDHLFLIAMGGLIFFMQAGMLKLN